MNTDRAGVPQSACPERFDESAAFPRKGNDKRYESRKKLRDASIRPAVLIVKVVIPSEGILLLVSSLGGAEAPPDAHTRATHR